MAEMLVQSESLVSIADAIREKGGTSDALVFPNEFVSAISAIQTSGILGHKFACGSFTLTEDTTTPYTILTDNELFEAVKDDFPGAVKLQSNVRLKSGSSSAQLFNFLAAICWIDNTEIYHTSTQAKQYLAAFLPKNSLNSSNCAANYTDSYGTFRAKSVQGIIKIDYSTGLTAGFGTDYKGYAGSKYNWLVIPLDHGEVA